MTQISGKISWVHRLEKLISLKCPYYLSHILSQCSPYQDSSGMFFFFLRNRKQILKFVWNHKRCLIGKGVLRKKNRVRSTTRLNFKLHCKAMEIKTAWSQNKSRHTEQWHRIKNPEINPRMIWSLISDKRAKNAHWRNDKLFFNEWWWENWIFTFKSIKLNPYLIPLTKSNSNGLRT